MPKGKRRKSVIKDGPNPIDVHVGARLKLRRHLLGMSQSALGDAVGLTFQQVQKYERGANRIGSSRLYEFSKLLDVPVSFFFDDMPKEISGLEPFNPDSVEDQLDNPETKELVEAYYKIPNVMVRKRLFETVKTIAKAEENRTKPD